MMIGNLPANLSFMNFASLSYVFTDIVSNIGLDIIFGSTVVRGKLCIVNVNDSVRWLVYYVRISVFCGKYGWEIYARFIGCRVVNIICDDSIY